MKLLTSPTTPFGRRAMIVAKELGLENKLEIIKTMPMTDNSLREKNPLGRIPVLITDDGQNIFDSNAILAYFQVMAKTTKFLPNSGMKQVDVLRRWAIGDGIMLAAMNIRHHAMRHEKNPDFPKTDFYLERQYKAIEAACAQLEAEIATFNRKSLDWGVITIACALEFVNFRMPELKWQKSCPKLKKWLKKIGAKPSFVATQPKD